jgi:hypothetical protein
MSGKAIKGIPVQNQEKALLNGLLGSLYIVQHEDNQSFYQKIIVQ